MNSPACRSCGALLTQTLLDLGEMPLANAYVNPLQADSPEPTYELHARVCLTCFLVQVNDAVPPAQIFTDYAYFSSFSTSWIKHAELFTKIAIDRLRLDKTSLVVEVASNDGYLLQHFVSENIPVLGIDPAEAAATAARKRDIPTEALFFGSQTAVRLREQYGEADLIVANNVLAHVPDMNDFISGFCKLLQGHGVVTFEFPHLLNLLELGQFDTIYHEHYSYLSLHSVEILLSKHGLRVFEAEEIPTHGGSLRLWVCHKSNIRPASSGLNMIRQKEKEFGIATPKAYNGFTAKADVIRKNLLRFLLTAKKRNQKVAAYGAAAKGNTLLNYCGITADDIEFVVDDNPHKKNLYMPGTRLPIMNSTAILDQDIKLCLLTLSAESEEKVIQNNQEYLVRGGHFHSIFPGNPLALSI